MQPWGRWMRWSGRRRCMGKWAYGKNSLTMTSHSRRLSPEPNSHSSGQCLDFVSAVRLRGRSRAENTTPLRGRQSLAVRCRPDGGDLRRPDQAARLQRPRFLNSGRSNLGLTSTLSVPRCPASSMPSQRRAMPSQNSRSVLLEAWSARLLHFLICS